ncbi:MAG: hypothetical protein ABSE22_14975 [Xanthobacteraceae bacterium]|jgi:hypothetical protein
MTQNAAQDEVPAIVSARGTVDTGALAAAFAQVPELLHCDENLVRRGAYFDARFRVEIADIPFDVKIENGRIVALERGPFLMRSWRFAVRGTAEAWSALWAPLPKPGWHDLFALTKRGCMTLEGDLHPAMANLQYLKDLLVLPRRLRKGL